VLILKVKTGGKYIKNLCFKMSKSSFSTSVAKFCIHSSYRDLSRSKRKGLLSADLLSHYRSHLSSLITPGWIRQRVQRNSLTEGNKGLALTFGQSKGIAGCMKISAHEMEAIEDPQLFPSFT
jgi:hypothetical protein